MANTKITDMTLATVPLTGAEVIPLVQNTGNVQATVLQVTAATYGEIYVVNGVVAQTLTNANTYYKLTAFTTDGLSNGTTPQAASDSIRIDIAGDYLIQFFITFSGANNKTFAFRCYNETTAAAYANTVVKSSSHSTDPMFVAVSAFVSAAANDVLIVQAACLTSGANITVSDANLAVLLLKAT
jgi:hypothetical protein